MNIIDKIKITPAEDRPALITGIYERNRDFFRRVMPDVDAYIDNTECPYHFDVTDSFINIIHSPSNRLAHPDGGLDVFAKALGEDNHGAWINLVNIHRSVIANSPLHHDITNTFEQTLNSSFPELAEQIDSGKVKIRTTGAKGRVMPPLVFAGIFHGLHIDYLLTNVDSIRLLLVEPEPERFEVSCYFLDYEKLFQNYNVKLNIGHTVHEATIKWFHSADKITSRLWFRVLPCYDSSRVEQVIQQLKIQQRILEGQTTSYDREFSAMQNGARNIAQKIPILSRRPELSKMAHIAVVASGPSLENDYDWLRKNQDNLIIIAVHSAVRPLLNNGIKVDFQISLDTYLTDEILDTLDLDNTIPFLSYYKASKETMIRFEQPLLLIEKNVANCVDFSFPLEDTFPSSTTLAASFALYCRPAFILLFGIDVGFRDPSSQFVSGGLHEKNGRTGIAGDIFQDIPNFKENGPVLTNIFFNQVKKCIERQIFQREDQVKILNLSDGAYIEGTSPVKSRNLILSEYLQKNHDIELIRDSFSCAKEDVNIRSYLVSGETLLNIFRKELIAGLQLRKYDWLEFSEKLDNCMAIAIDKCKEFSLCLRMTIYERVITDLLTQWYRFILLSPNPQYAEKVYRAGLKNVCEVIERLQWPS